MTNKLLNLDDFARDEKIIKLDGVEHAMREMTVEEFIREAKAAKSATDANLSLDEQTERAVDSIHRSFPTISKARLNALPLPHLTAILEFVMTPPEDIARKAEAAAGNG